MTKASRNPTEVIDQIIKALGGYEHWPIACDDLERLKVTHSFRAPELNHLTWEAMTEIMERVVGDIEPKDFNEQQKAAIRIFTDNPNIV